MNADKKTFIVTTVVLLGYFLYFLVSPDDSNLVGIPKEIVLGIVCMAYFIQCFQYLGILLKNRKNRKDRNG